ncbi:YceD family protein [Curtanaerobium respiraculi]|uniref:YceD family protein n=1 Tax=Curtanaerobium respiraculi TaxID=2949669 RepID=UPI0024B38491|nr:DUF177 domain-containing protein [Curtanaerobium respiraculi]
MSNTVVEIPQELFAPAESSSFAGQLEPRTIEAGPDTYAFEQPLEWELTISNTGEGLLIDGTVTGTGATRCGRCLADMHVDIEGRIEGYYLLPGAGDPENMDDDEFARLPESNKIDLEPHIIAAVLVDVPLVPLCREDCKGLCPDCGANLNDETCDCASKRARQAKEDAEASNPFATLKNLTFDE